MATTATTPQQSVGTINRLLDEGASLLLEWSTTTLETENKEQDDVLLESLMVAMEQCVPMAVSSAVDDSSHDASWTTTLDVLWYIVELWTAQSAPQPAFSSAATLAPSFKRATRVFFWALQFVESIRNESVATSHHTTNQINSMFALVVHALLTEVTDATHGNAKADAEIARTIQTMIQRMSQLYKQKEGLHPNTTSLNAILRTLSLGTSVDYFETNDHQSAVEADAMLQEMLEESRTVPQVAPNSTTFNMVLQAYARAGDFVAAERILHQMILESDRSAATIQPTRLSFNFVLDAFAKRGQASAAEKLLLWMENLAEDWARPDSASYTAVITAHARGEGGSGIDNAGAKIAPEAVDQAELWLSRVLELYQSGENSQVAPTVHAFTAVLTAYAKSDLPDRAIRAHRLMESMKALPKEQEHHENRKETVAPTVATYNAWLQVQANANDSKEENVKRCLKILNAMEKDELYLQQRPNLRTYNIVLTCIAKSGLLEQAQEVWERIYRQGLEPNVISFNIFLDALAHSGRSDAPERAMKLLTQMQQQTPPCKPTFITYNTIMKVWSKATSSDGRPREDAPRHVETLLAEMERANLATGASFVTCIHTWSQSRHKDKAVFALGVLRGMEQYYRNHHSPESPTGKNDNQYSDRRTATSSPAVSHWTNAYNACLNACAFTRGSHVDRRRALDIAMQLFDELLVLHEEENASLRVAMNELTFATLLKACINLTPGGSVEERMSLMKPVLDACCARGFAGRRVEKELNYALTREQRGSLLGLNKMPAPPEWSRNVASRPRLTTAARPKRQEVVKGKCNQKLPTGSEN